MKTHVDEYLLELILMDTISVTGGRCIPQAERAIQRYIPWRLYDQIIARYDELSDDFDAQNPRALRRWLRMAARKQSPWKQKMVVRFLHILSASGPIGVAELTDVAALAAQMGASRECRQVFGRFLGWTHPSAQALRGPTPRRQLSWLPFEISWDVLNADLPSLWRPDRSCFSLWISFCLGVLGPYALSSSTRASSSVRVVSSRRQ